jgi:predicted permease
MLGRPLLDSDDRPGAPGVVVVSYELWQRSLGGRRDAVGSVVRLGTAPATVIGVMPEGFAYPINHAAWTPLPLRASYSALEGGSMAVIGRLAPGVSLPQARAELRVLGERASAALPATHQHLRPTVLYLAGTSDDVDLILFASQTLPILVVLLIACTSVGTLVYARTATREGEIAVRFALGANRARIMAQLFVEALVLAAIAAAAGLLAANQALKWGIDEVNRSSGGAPFWMTPGLTLSTVLYAAGLAVVSAAMLSVLPALRATKAYAQSHLASLGSGGSTLRFGRVWTGAMIFQVALTAMGIPGAMEAANEAMLKLNIREAFPSRSYLAASIDPGRPFDGETEAAFEGRRARTFAALAQRVAQEPGVIAITFADMAPGSGTSERFTEVESPSGAGTLYAGFKTSAVGPGFFEAFDRPVVAGRAFREDDWNPAARTVIVNEAFARKYAGETGRGSPVGARLRQPASSTPVFDDDDPDASQGFRRADRGDDWFVIVGVVRNFGLYPDDSGDEQPFVFHTASAGTVSPLVMSVRTRGNPAALAARLPIVSAGVDASLIVRDAQPLETSIREGHDGLAVQATAFAGVTLLVLFLSALGIFSLVSVGVSRRTREIGLRTALGAHPRQVLAGILSHATVLMLCGVTAGGSLVLLVVANGGGPSGRPADDLPLFARYLAATAVVMLTASVLAAVGPARRALGINPSEALRET